MHASAVGISGLLLALLAPPASAATPDPEAKQIPCGPVQFQISVSPPDGLVAVVDVVMTPTCRLVPSEIRFVDPASLPASDRPHVISSISSSSTEGSATVATAISTKWAYNVGRTWDCCGIKTSEYWTENQWSYDGTKITQWLGQDGSEVHKEADGRGWSANLGDYYLKLTSGGIGQTSETIKGHLGFSYIGIFDGSGNDYYTAYWNTMTGFRDGSKSCVHTYSWKKSFAGWSYQGLCGFGQHP